MTSSATAHRGDGHRALLESGRALPPLVGGRTARKLQVPRGRSRPSAKGRAATRDRSGILVVDPDASVRAFLADALADSADVIEASGLAEALLLFSVSRARRFGRLFDAVLVDCGEPDRRTGELRGVELIRSICAIDGALPVIATSAAIDSDQVADRALRSGARDFLKKPFGVDELMAAIVRAWDPENGGL